jgi:hypothetical protein
MASGNEEEEDEDSDDYNFSYNPIDHETPEERESRMKLVRQLQKSFYKDEEGPTLSEAASSESSSSTDATIISNLPLWRVQWTELPGSQNVLNVHVPHYTNMFQKILRGKSREWGDDGSDGNDDSEDIMKQQHHYFGHIFLPGGSENLDDPSYELQVGDIGTLMTISDARQQSDGRLTLIVQALERFEIQRVERSHSPYAIADVAILPDSEQLIDVAGMKITIDNDNATSIADNASDDDNDNDSDKKDRALAVSEAFANHPFEYRRVSIDECEITSDDGTVVGLGVSPLSNYDATKQRLRSEKSNPDTGIDINIDIDNDAHHRDLVAIAESQVWIQLDELLKLLRIASNGVGVPVPTQLMGLLPRSRSALSSQDTTAAVVVTEEPWPDKFDLERLATNFEDQSGTVGTHSKSPFVRVDEKISNESNENNSSQQYSSLRRAQRLSYVVWTLSESIALPPEPGSSSSDGTVDKYSRESILALTSIQERLELATEKMNKICLLLKKILRLKDK